jgi:hypothetical protein
MIRRRTVTLRTALGAALTAAALAACGQAVVTNSPTPAATVTPAAPASHASATASASTASASALTSAVAPSGSVTPEPTQDLSAGLPHLDARLEDLLPSEIGGIPLEKLSLPLSTYMASETCSATNPCSDKALYTPWLVAFGKTPDDATLAVATDLTGRENVIVQAFKVPGVDGTRLAAGFKTTAQNAGWPTAAKSIADKTVAEIIDEARVNLDLVSIAYVYAKGDVMYLVATDDPALLLEVMILLP